MRCRAPRRRTRPQPFGRGVLLCIGTALVAAQSGACQGAEALLSLDLGDRHGVAAELLDDLRPDASQSWRRAFARASLLGPVVVPALWRQLEGDSNVRGRLLMVAALGAAGGEAAERDLVSWLRRADLREQVMALLVLATGPRHSEEPPEELSRAFMDAKLAAVRIAGALALGRYQGRANPPAEWFTGEGRGDPGWVAAAVSAGAEPPAAILDRWLKPSTADPAGLVARACLLAEPSPLATAALDSLALDVLGRPEAARTLREAAALRLSGRTPSPLPVGSAEPAAETVAILASAAPGRGTALARGWLKPLPSATVELEVQQRLAVAFALAAPLNQIGAAVDEWRRYPEVGGVACLALAWRAFSGDVEPEVLARCEWLPQLAALPEAAWLDTAAGKSPPPPAGASDGEPTRALALAARGRLPAAAATGVLARELWRRGAHPGQACHRARLELVRDLLLTGSKHAKARLLGRDYADSSYLPDGLQTGDGQFFEVAYEYFDWVLREPAPDLLARR